MKQLGIKQAREQLPALIDRAEAGEEVIITRQGKPVAKLVPAPKPRRRLPSLLDFRKRIGKVGESSAEILRAERDAR